MKKLLTIGLSLAVMFSTFSMVVAEGTTSDTPAVKAKVEKVRKEIPQELKDKKEVLQQLDAQAKKMVEELKAAKGEAKNKLKEGLTKIDPAKIKEARVKAEEAKKAYESKFKDLHLQLKTAIKERNKEKVNAIMDEVTKVEQEQKAKRDELLKLKEDQQLQSTKLKEFRENAKALEEKLKPYRDEQKSISTQLKTMHETRESYNQELKNALEKKDYATASAVLDKTISLKKEIISKLTRLVEIKNQINNLTNN